MRTTTALPIPGVYNTTIRVTIDDVVVVKKGRSFAKNVRAELSDVRERAIQHALATLLINRGELAQGVNSPQLKRKLRTIDYEEVERYFTYKVARQRYRYKRITIRGRYYTQVRTRDTGRIVTTIRWSSRTRRKK